MGQAAITCALGEIQVMHVEVMENMTREGKVSTTLRQHLWMSFDPNWLCMKFFELVGNSVEGVEAINRSLTQGTTVILVLREDVDPKETAKRFIRAFKQFLEELPYDELHQLTGGMTLPDMAMATHSESRAWMSSES